MSVSTAVEAVSLEEATLSRKDLAYRTLRRKILTCEILPGQQISEAELQIASEQPRTPTREAALILTFQGLLEVMPRRGYVVASISAKSAGKLIDLHDLISSEVIRESTRPYPRHVIDHLRDFIAHPPKGTPEERRAAMFDISDLLFETLAAGTDNPWLRRSYELVNVHMQRLWAFLYVKTPLNQMIRQAFVPLLEILEAEPEDREPTNHEGSGLREPLLQELQSRIGDGTVTE